MSRFKAPFENNNIDGFHCKGQPVTCIDQTSKKKLLVVLVFLSIILLAAIPAFSSTIDTEDTEWLEQRIECRKDRLENAYIPEYKKLSSTLSFALRSNYYELYYTGLEYHKLSKKAFELAAEHFEEGELARANELVHRSTHYGYLSATAFKASENVKLRDLGILKTTAERISESCQAVSTLGLTVVGSPTAAKVVDYLYLFTEEGTRWVLTGEEPDKSRIIQKIIIKETFDRIHWPQLDGLTVSEAIKESTGPVFPHISKVLRSEDFLEKLTEALAEKGFERVAEKIANSERVKQIAQDFANSMTKPLDK